MKLLQLLLPLALLFGVASAQTFTVTSQQTQSCANHQTYVNGVLVHRTTCSPFTTTLSDGSKSDMGFYIDCVDNGTDHIGGTFTGSILQGTTWSPFSGTYVGGVDSPGTVVGSWGVNGSLVATFGSHVIRHVVRTAIYARYLATGSGALNVP